MWIQIALKLRPFSHQVGTAFFIPYTSWEVRIFPTKLFFCHLEKGEKKELDLPIKGPVEKFTATLDLNKGHIEVFGFGADGYFRYLIEKNLLRFIKGERIALDFIQSKQLPPCKERISFGCHKAQEWDYVQRRLNMGEIFPFWLKAASLIPDPLLPLPSGGSFALLKESSQPPLLRFTHLFQVGFQGILSPRAHDENYLGILKEEEILTPYSPLSLLHESARQIKALFFKQEEAEIFLLPHLPKELHAGRFVDIRFQRGELSFEWSKKELKKVLIAPDQDQVLRLHIPPMFRSFRIRSNRRERGIRIKRGEPLALEKGKKIFLDRFEK